MVLPVSAEMWLLKMLKTADYQILISFLGSENITKEETGYKSQKTGKGLQTAIYRA